MSAPRGEDERRVVVRIPADFAFFMPRVDKVFGYLDKAVSRGEMEVGVASVLEVGVAEDLGVVADDALD